MRKLKIFGGYIDGKRAIMGCYSRVSVAAATGDSLGAVRKYWSETRNDDEVALATLHPGTLFVEIDAYGRNFKEVVP